MTRILTALAGLLITALALAGCAGLPTGGAVHAGRTTGQLPDTPDFSFVPGAPQQGMTPLQIVQGFIAAGTSPEDDWRVARLYLADDFDTWVPTAGVTIDALGDSDYTEVAEDHIDLTVTPVADVDEHGAYSPQSGGASTLSFRLAVQDDGEWRITEAPDGIILDPDFFLAVFHAYPVMYFDPTWTYLVPDVRWFPSRGNPATRVVQALANGSPSPWLAASVVSAFPEGVSLGRQYVTIDSDRVATVELADGALGLDQLQRDRMQAQLAASLSGVGVAAVEMAVEGTVLEANAAATASTDVESRALVLRDDEFGFLGGQEIAPVPGLSPVIAEMSPRPLSIELGADQSEAAVRNQAGAVARVRADGETLEIDTRAGLIDPTIDPWGYIWTVPRDTPGAVLVSGREGAAPVAIVGAWPGATQLRAMQVSRDGTRIVGVGTFGGQQWVMVAGIVRDAEGTPTALGEPMPVGRVDLPATAVSWLDQSTVGVVTTDGAATAVVEQGVGGPASRTTAPDSVTGIAGSNLASTARVHGDDGTIYVRRGSTWRPTAVDIAVLATQQGPGAAQ